MTIEQEATNYYHFRAITSLTLCITAACSTGQIVFLHQNGDHLSGAVLLFALGDLVFGSIALANSVLELTSGYRRILKSSVVDNIPIPKLPVYENQLGPVSRLLYTQDNLMLLRPSWK